MGVPILLAQHGYATAPKRSRTETGNPAFNNYMCESAPTGFNTVSTHPPPPTMPNTHTRTHTH